MSHSNASGVPINIDMEITRLQDDRLGRDEYARRIAARITDAGSGPSVVFGLAGPWGSGKSSVINMIIQAIQSARPDEWSITTLTAWSAADTDALTEEFYRAIASAMPRNDTGKKAKRMLAAAAPVASAVGKAAVQSLTERYLGKGAWQEMGDAATGSLADRLGEFRFDADPFIQRFRAISDAIAAAGKNVLVVVDDVDRLHTDELLSLMKAVRLLGRFDRVHYLLAYDEHTVLDVLTGSDLARNNRPRARQYLEKIVQYPFVLPPLQPFHLEAELRGQLGGVAGHHGHSLDQPTSYRGDAVDEILDAIPHIDSLTLRSINRLCHQLDTMLTLVGGREVDLVDATLLVYLR
ncbi:P-loop NTPase fold protein, partial [Streptomyces sp. NPDC058171]